MYLASKWINGEKHYYIRASLRRGKGYCSQTLLSLGTHPERYIIYPGGRSFYIHPDISDRLIAKGHNPSCDDLDQLFWSFLRPDIRRTLEPVYSRGAAMASKTHGSVSTLHLFDRRRVHYLRFGQLDQGSLGRDHPVLFKGLHAKSRDEIEQWLMDKETILTTQELKSYVYVIFDLQRFFGQGFAKTIPQGLPSQQVDDAFLKEICRLNSNETFWGDRYTETRLNEYLVRYVIMYFDHDFPHVRPLADYFERFINSRRNYRAPAPRGRISTRMASSIFNISKEEMAAMKRSQLARLYRKRALKLHPDRGGDHDRFIKLTEAYHDMLSRKSA